MMPAFCLNSKTECDKKVEISLKTEVFSFIIDQNVTFKNLKFTGLDLHLEFDKAKH